MKTGYYKISALNRQPKSPCLSLSPKQGLKTLDENRLLQYNFPLEAAYSLFFPEKVLES